MIKKEFLNICFKHSWFLFEILEVYVNLFKFRQFIQNSFDFIFKDGYILIEGESPPRKFNFPQLNFEFDNSLSICINNGGMDIILNTKHSLLGDQTLEIAKVGGILFDWAHESWVILGSLTFAVDVGIAIFHNF